MPVYLGRRTEEAVKSWTEEQNEKENRAYLQYAHRCLLLSVRNEGFGGVRLLRLSHNAFTLGEAVMAETNAPELITDVADLLAGAEPEFRDMDFFEHMRDTYFKLLQDMRQFGWDPESSLWTWKEPYGEGDFPPTWRKITASQRRKRAEYLFFVNEMSRLCLVLLCMCAEELHQTNGFGADRMDRVMRPVAERWDRLMRLYLAEDRRGIWAERKAVRDAFNEMEIFTKEYGI